MKNLIGALLLLAVASVATAGAMELLSKAQKEIAEEARSRYTYSRITR